MSVKAAGLTSNEKVPGSNLNLTSKIKAAG